jgi:hypothetical protein
VTVVYLRQRMVDPMTPEAPAPTRDVLDLLRTAILRAGSSQKATAISMGISGAQLSRQLSGVERLPLEQLARDPQVLAEFGCLVAEHFGHRVRRTGAAARRAARIQALQRELLALLDEDVRDHEVA